VNKYLLDTHIFLWSLLDPDHLSAEVAIVLADKNNELWLSPITSWEVIVLAEKGRIRLNDKPAPWLKNVFRTIPFREAGMTHEVAMESRKLQLPHQDPADRFIAASAVVYGLTLITSDQNLLLSNDYTILKN
jgi:PIN domain nuclease of toxin-antitoxin system